MAEMFGGAIMKLKRMIRYQVEIGSKMSELSAALMGAAFFLQALYFFLVKDLSSCSVGEVVLRLILPLVACAAWMILLRLTPVSNAIIYGVCAAVLCVLLAVLGFYGNAMLALIGLIWYLACGAVAVLICFGYMPYRILLFFMLLVSAVLRSILALGLYILPGNYWNGLPEFAAVFANLALLCLPYMLRPIKR